jgi:hypothetical protein
MNNSNSSGGRTSEIYTPNILFEISISDLSKEITEEGVIMIWDIYNSSIASRQSEEVKLI